MDITHDNVCSSMLSCFYSHLLSTGRPISSFKLFCPFSLSDDMLEWNPFDSEPTEDSFGVQFDKLRKTHGSNDSKCWVQTCKYIFPCQDKLVVDC